MDGKKYGRLDDWDEFASRMDGWMIAFGKDDSLRVSDGMIWNVSHFGILVSWGRLWGRDYGS